MFSEVGGAWATLTGWVGLRVENYVPNKDQQGQRPWEAGRKRLWCGSAWLSDGALGSLETGAQRGRVGAARGDGSRRGSLLCTGSGCRGRSRAVSGAPGAPAWQCRRRGSVAPRHPVCCVNRCILHLCTPGKSSGDFKITLAMEDSASKSKELPHDLPLHL